MIRHIAERLSVIPFGVGILLLTTAGCRGLEALPEEPTGNLLENGTFEANGEPTLKGWEVQSPELASLVEEAAPEGGSWSLRLEADWAPTLGYAGARIAGARDGDILRLSAQVRADSPSGGAVIGLVVGTGIEYGERRHAKLASSSAATWTSLSVTDTLTVGEGESVWALLSSPHTEVEARSGLFDLVTVERLERLED